MALPAYSRSPIQVLTGPAAAVHGRTSTSSPRSMLAAYRAPIKTDFCSCIIVELTILHYVHNFVFEKFAKMCCHTVTRKLTFTNSSASAIRVFFVLTTLIYKMLTINYIPPYSVQQLSRPLLTFTPKSDNNYDLRKNRPRTLCKTS